MNRKIKAILLAALMICCMAPAGAFAADKDLVLVGGEVTVDGTADRNVDVVVQADSEMTVIAFEGVFSQTETDGTQYIRLTKLTPPDSVVLGDYDTNSTTSGRVAWADDTSFSGYSVKPGGAVWTAQYTVDKNTPSGVYTVQFSLTDLCDETYASVLSGKNYTTTIAVNNDSQNLSGGYSAALEANADSVDVGGTVSVAVNVASGEYENFASGEVKVAYDPDILAFNETASLLHGAEVSDNSGTLVIEDYGENQNLGTAYMLAFTGTAKGETAVTLTSAAFSTQLHAEKNDLIPANISQKSVAIAVKQTYAVELPAIFKGEALAEEGKNYTFYPADDAAYYEYGPIEAMVGNQPVTVIDNGDGSYTVENITGPLTISGERIGKTYTVAVDGSGKGDVAADTTAQFGSDYSFTMPQAAGYVYELVSIRYANGNDVPYAREGATVKILGTDITGNFTIEISKTELPSTAAAVTVEGNAAGDVTASGHALEGTDYTFAVRKDSRYDYVVTVTIDGTVVTVEESEGTYLIPASVFKAGDDIVIEVNKFVKIADASVSKYVTLDESQMWLVVVPAEKQDGQVLTCDGEKMFWSEKYGAYCCVMISSGAQPEISASDLAFVNGSATEVDYGMDVNLSGKVDANDAQLVYNMYNAHYDNFTDDVTAEKFLRADVNGDKALNTQDAAAIIDFILS